MKNLNPLINTEIYLELWSLSNRRICYTSTKCVYDTASFANIYGGNLQAMHSNVCERQSPTATDAQRRIIVCVPWFSGSLQLHQWLRTCRILSLSLTPVIYNIYNVLADEVYAFVWLSNGYCCVRVNMLLARRDLCVCCSKTLENGTLKCFRGFVYYVNIPSNNS